MSIRVSTYSLRATAVIAICTISLAGCSELAKIAKPSSQASASKPAAAPPSLSSPSPAPTPEAPNPAITAQSYSAPPSDGLPQGQTVGRIVASVDGEPITAHDIEVFTAAVGRPVKADDLQDNQMAKDALKGLISQKLLENEVERYSDKVDEAQIDRYTEEIRREKHLTPDQFKAALTQSGLSFDDFRKHARQELEKAMMLQQQVRDKVEISETDIEVYYDQHKGEYVVEKERFRIAQILVAVPDNATPQQVSAAQAKAEKIRKAAVTGIDFGDLAAKYSDDDSKKASGELGWFEPGDIQDQIVAALRKIKPGDISETVRSSHGFHILKLEAHETPGTRPIEEVKTQIREKILDQKFKEHIQSWIETDLVKQHDVQMLY